MVIIFLLSRSSNLAFKIFCAKCYLKLENSFQRLISDSIGSDQTSADFANV